MLVQILFNYNLIKKKEYIIEGINLLNIKIIY